MATVEELLELLRSRAGDHVRLVGEYDEESLSIQYLREDLDRGAIEEQGEKIRKNLLDASLGHRDHGLTEHVGERYATMHLREDALIVTIPTETWSAVVFSLDPEAGRNLTAFLSECVETVTGEQPHHGPS